MQRMSGGFQNVDTKQKGMAMQMKKTLVSVNTAKCQGTVSDTLIGLFWEDINYSCDGGLNANLVRNYSFDDVYLTRRKVNDFDFLLGHIKPDEHLATEADPIRYWKCVGGKLTAGTQDPISINSCYGNVAVVGSATLENLGYNGHHVDECAMSIEAGMDYTLSLYIRSMDYDGTLSVSVQSGSGQLLTNSVKLPMRDHWEKVQVTLNGCKTEYGKLVFSFEGSGTVQLDAVMLYRNDYWGKGDPKWSQGLLRRDLVEAIRDLHPRFLRFPGGCVVEGLDMGNEYHWKDSVGELIDRKADYNLWSYREDDFGYAQSRQIGFYEFFLLCEDLKMEPLPVVWAGMNCQMRKRGAIPVDSEEFQRDVIQNTLDLIEYANGDPAVSDWAKLRAEAGHPEPFHMKYIGIGNENFGEDYLKRFRAVKQAIDEKYPGITCILSCGSDPDGKNFEYSWNETKKDLPDVYVDEHFYKKPSWLPKQVSRYDQYSRTGAKVFLGEWAAFDPVKGMFSKTFVPNTYESALAEAAFLTGIERNADVVAMTCYAPLFAMIDGSQWQHNLIWFNPAHVLKTANYYVQQMFSTTVGKQIPEVEAQLPKGVFASATCDEGYVCLKLVNTTANPCVVELALHDFHATKVKQTTLCADNLRTANSLRFHGTPIETVKPEVSEASAENMKSVTLGAQAVAVYQFYV